MHQVGDSLPSHRGIDLYLKKKTSSIMFLWIEQARLLIEPVFEE
jgi:hypothetical protein